MVAPRWRSGFAPRGLRCDEMTFIHYTARAGPGWAGSGRGGEPLPRGPGHQPPSSELSYVGVIWQAVSQPVELVSQRWRAGAGRSGAARRGRPRPPHTRLLAARCAWCGSGGPLRLASVVPPRAGSARGRRGRQLIVRAACALCVLPAPRAARCAARCTLLSAVALLHEGEDEGGQRSGSIGTFPRKWKAMSWCIIRAIKQPRAPLGPIGPHWASGRPRLESPGCPATARRHHFASTWLRVAKPLRCNLAIIYERKKES